MNRRHGWIRHFVHDFEHNPRFQFKFHLTFMAFWIVNGIVGTCVAIIAPQDWLKIGVLYVFWLSIYANWDTDYDAVSASLAAQHGEDLVRRADAETAISQIPASGEQS